jgi:hypothetical protein
LILSITLTHAGRPFAFTSIGASGKSDAAAFRQRVRSEIERESARIAATGIAPDVDARILVKRATDFGILKLRSGRCGQTAYAQDGSVARGEPSRADGLVMKLDVAA